MVCDDDHVYEVENISEALVPPPRDSPLANCKYRWRLKDQQSQYDKELLLLEVTPSTNEWKVFVFIYLGWIFVTVSQDYVDFFQIRSIIGATKWLQIGYKDFSLFLIIPFSSFISLFILQSS